MHPGFPSPRFKHSGGGLFFLVPAGVERLSVEFARPGNWVISYDAFNLAVKVAGPDNEREDRGAGERN